MNGIVIGMLALLPAVAFGVWATALWTAFRTWGWGRVLLRTAVLLGSAAVVITEALSRAHAITQTGLAFAWGAAALAGLALLLVRLRAGARLSWPVLPFPQRWDIRLGVLAVLLILVLTGVLAWMAPPNTWDSLNYHMARVAHWAQARSVEHYPTGVEIQNGRAPGAEYLLLHLYVLAASDRWVNLVSWCGFAGSLLGVWLLTRCLSKAGPGPLMAVLYAATLPVAIIQASSTMNDLVLGFWLVVVAVESVDLWSGGPVREAPASLAAAAGLALLTKPTAVAFLLSFAVADGIGLWRRRGRGSSLAIALGAVCVVGLLNAGHLGRNWATYGSPVDGHDLERHANRNYDPRAIASNLLRNAALHLGTPSPYLNKFTALSIQWLHRLLGVDPNDPRTTAAGQFRIHPSGLSENRTANPLHALLAAATVLLLMARRHGLFRAGWVLAGVVAGSVVAFGALYKWLPFNARLHTPAFMLFAPVTGCVLGTLRPERWARWIGAALVLSCLPWVVGLRTRPWIRLSDAESPRSVLTEERARLYFAEGPYLEAPYRTMVSEIERAGCDRVGIMLSGDNAEYPLWVLLGAPRSGLRLEWIVAGTPSARYADPRFRPCAVICQDCPGDWAEVRGLPLAMSVQGYQLFAAPVP